MHCTKQYFHTCHEINYKINRRSTLDYNCTSKIIQSITKINKIDFISLAPPIILQNCLIITKFTSDPLINMITFYFDLFHNLWLYFMIIIAFYSIISSTKFHATNVNKNMYWIKFVVRAWVEHVQIYSDKNFVHVQPKNSMPNTNRTHT